MKRLAIIFLVFSLGGCAYYDALFTVPAPKTAQDYRKAIVASEVVLTQLLSTATVAEKQGVIVHGGAFEGTLTKSFTLATSSLNGADKAARSGDLTTANLLYQTALGTIAGLQTNIPGAQK